MIQIYYNRGYKIRTDNQSLRVESISFYDETGECPVFNEILYGYKGDYTDESPFVHTNNLRRIKKITFDDILYFEKSEGNFYYLNRCLYLPKNKINYRETTHEIRREPYEIIYSRCNVFDDMNTTHRVDVYHHSMLTKLGNKLHKMLIDNDHFISKNWSTVAHSVGWLYHKIFTEKDRKYIKIFDKYRRDEKLKKILG